MSSPCDVFTCINMKHNSVLFLPLLLAAAVSCTKEASYTGGMPSDGQTSIIAKVEEASAKTTLSGYQVLWSASDAVKVFNSSMPDGSAFILEASSAGKAYGTFRGVMKGEAPYYAVYPSSDGVSLSGSTLSVSLPSVQTYCESSFGIGANPCVAVSDENGVLQFKNLCGLLKLQLKGSIKISSLAITTGREEALWGDGTVDMSLPGDPVLKFTSSADEAHRTLTLRCSSPVQLSTSVPTSFYIVLPAGVLSGGFTVSAYDASSGGTTIEAAAVTGNTIVRSAVKSMPAVNVASVTFPDISTLTSLGDSFDLNLNGITWLPYKGAKVGDYITLTGREDNTKVYKAVVEKVDNASGIALRSPDYFVGGMYRMTLTMNGKTWTAGTTFINVVDPYEVTRKTLRTMYGRVVDQYSRPVRGVSVSDGVLSTVTDENGCYYLNSARKYGYVMISSPSGYRVPVKAGIPQFYKKVSATKATYEMNNFVLEKVDDSNNRVVFFTDCHLADRSNNDLYQFRNGFVKEMDALASDAYKVGKPFYAICLGDTCWEQYWTQYAYPDLLNEIFNFAYPTYYIPGNHDNDPAVKSDFEGEKPFRNYIGPCYFSFSVGRTHYVVMDNTQYTGYSSAGGNTYSVGFTTDETAWLKADLSNLGSDITTVVVGAHIQFTSRPYLPDDNHTGVWFNNTMPESQRNNIVSWAGGRDVRLITGHTHQSHTNIISDKLTEYNLCSVCGGWWFVGKYTNYRTNLCTDGTPNGYLVRDETTSGSNLRFKPILKDENYQFRAYDLNNCVMTKSEYCPNGNADDFHLYARGYDSRIGNNLVRINIFRYSPSWTVKVTENGKELTPVRVEAYDPLYVAHFNMYRVNRGSSLSFEANAVSHFFDYQCSSASSSLVITVTDEYGNTYTETMTRPRKLSDMKTSTKW